MKNDFRPEDEINYKNLLKSPLRLFGVIYPFFAILIIAGGIYWIFNLDWAYKNSMKPAVLARDTVAVPIAMTKGSAIMGVDVKVIGKSTPELVAKGQQIYSSNCASCHGDKGDGAGVASKAFNPSPRNFLSKDGWKNGQKLSQMWKTLDEGLAGTGMISYNFLQVSDRFAIIHYIHSLMGDYPKDTDSELADLDVAYKLSEDKVEPNKIPIELADAALIAENKANQEKIVKIEELMSGSDDPGAMLLLSNSKDQRKFILSLLRSDEWKKGQTAFANEIASNLNNNGCKASILRLKVNEIASIHSYLLRTFSQI